MGLALLTWFLGLWLFSGLVHRWLSHLQIGHGWHSALAKLAIGSIATLLAAAFIAICFTPIMESPAAWNLPEAVYVAALLWPFVVAVAGWVQWWIRL